MGEGGETVERERMGKCVYKHRCIHITYLCGKLVTRASVTAQEIEVFHYLVSMKQAIADADPWENTL